MKPFPRRFVVDLDAMECYSEPDRYAHETLENRTTMGGPREHVVALISTTDLEAPTISSYIMGSGESRIRATDKMHLTLRLVQV